VKFEEIVQLVPSNCHSDVCAARGSFQIMTEGWLVLGLGAEAESSVPISRYVIMWSVSRLPPYCQQLLQTRTYSTAAAPMNRKNFRD
jgi:hypothetical protein